LAEKGLLGTYEGQHLNGLFLTIWLSFCSLQKCPKMAVFARVQNLALSLLFGLFSSRFFVVEESKFKMVVRVVDKCQLDHNRTRFSYIFGAFKFSQIGHFFIISRGFSHCKQGQYRKYT